MFLKTKEPIWKLVIALAQAVFKQLDILNWQFEIQIAVCLSFIMNLFFFREYEFFFGIKSLTKCFLKRMLTHKNTCTVCTMLCLCDFLFFPAAYRLCSWPVRSTKIQRKFFYLRVLSILVQKEILNFEKFAQHRYPGPNSLALHAKNCFNDVQLTAEDQFLNFYENICQTQ